MARKKLNAQTNGLWRKEREREREKMNKPYDDNDQWWLPMTMKPKPTPQTKKAPDLNAKPVNLSFIRSKSDQNLSFASFVLTKSMCRLTKHRFSVAYYRRPDAFVSITLIVILCVCVCSSEASDSKWIDQPILTKQLTNYQSNRNRHNWCKPKQTAQKTDFASVLSWIERLNQKDQNCWTEKCLIWFALAFNSFANIKLDEIIVFSNTRWTHLAAGSGPSVVDALVRFGKCNIWSPLFWIRTNSNFNFRVHFVSCASTAGPHVFAVYRLIGPSKSVGRASYIEKRC